MIGFLLFNFSAYISVIIFAASSHEEKRVSAERFPLPRVDPFAVKQDEAEILRSILEGSIEDLEEHREFMVEPRALISLSISRKQHHLAQSSLKTAGICPEYIFRTRAKKLHCE